MKGYSFFSADADIVNQLDLLLTGFRLNRPGQKVRNQQRHNGNNF